MVYIQAVNSRSSGRFIGFTTADNPIAATEKSKLYGEPCGDPFWSLKFKEGIKSELDWNWKQKGKGNV